MPQATNAQTVISTSTPSNCKGVTMLSANALRSYLTRGLHDAYVGIWTQKIIALDEERDSCIFLIKGRGEQYKVTIEKVKV